MKNTKVLSKSVVNGALSLTVSGLIVKFLGLIYKVPLSYLLSDEGMGYFNSAYTVYTFFYIICTAGIPKAISILTSEAEGDGEHGRVGTIYKTAFSSFFIFGLAVTVAFLLSASFISDFIDSRGSYLTMLAIAPSILFVCLSGVIRGYFNGRLSFIPIAVSEVISGVSRLVLGLAFAIIASRAGLGLEGISALTILGTTLGAAFGFVYLWICKKREKTDKIIEQKSKTISFSPRITKRIIMIATPITLTSAVGSISAVIDLSIIMKRLCSAGYSELQAGILYGNYTTLAIPMLNLIATLIAPLSTVLLPLVSKGSVKNDKALLSARISFTTKILSFISVPISILFLFRAKEILSIIFEDSSAAMAAPLLSILSLGIVFMCLLTTINTTLEGIGRTKVPLISLLIGSIVKFAVSYILIGIGEYGILGAPLGTVLSYFVSFLVSYYYISVIQKVKINILPSVLPVLFSAVVSIVICGSVRALLGVEGTLVYIAEIGLFAIIYVILLSFLRFFDLKKAINLVKYTKKQ